jgi:dynactin complex subunit
MGNIICVQGFTSSGFAQCVVQCPNEKGFENISEGSTIKCVYKADTKQSVNLNPLTAYVKGEKDPLIGTIADLQKVNPTLAGSYSAEKDRVDKEIAKLISSIGKEKQVQDAFKELQTAENIRDTTPHAYQQARYTYYTLLEGDKWKDKEKQRLEKAEVDPEVDKIRQSIKDLMNQIRKQQDSIQSMKNIRDKVVSVKDEFKYSVDTLNKQLENVQTELVLQKRKTEEKQENDWSSIIHFVLNVVIIIALGSIGFMVYKILIKKRFERTYEPPTQIQIVKGGNA